MNTQTTWTANRVSRPAVALAIILLLILVSQVCRVVALWPVYISFDLDDPVDECFHNRWLANTPKMGTPEERTVVLPPCWAFFGHESRISSCVTEYSECPPPPIHAWHIALNQFGFVVHHDYFESEFAAAGYRAWEPSNWLGWYSRGSQGYQRYEWFFVRHTVTIPIAVYLVFAFLRPLIRHLYRRRRGLCLTCGYSLTGLSEPRCPECGSPFPGR